MKFMDRMPTVISCCFCCFLRAGTVLIAVFSFIIGVLFAPNVSQTRGYWDMNMVLSNYSDMTENTAQLTLGISSIMLCIASFLLLIGACCNIPVLIEIYQWGAIFYSATLILLFLILAILCFFGHTNCVVAGGVLCGLVLVVVLFVIMCDQIFPEVDTCCMLVSVRVGMILIGVLSISTGAITLGVMQQKRNIDFDTVSSIYNKANYSKPEQVFSDLSNIISVTCTAMSVAFMFAGIALLFSTLADQEGFAQIFVILVFMNVLIGTLALVAISFECMYLEDECLLENMDWLSGSITLLAILFYLIIWYYFCCVANSYALNAYA